MAEDNHTVDGLNATVGMAAWGVRRHALHFLIWGRSTPSGVFEAWVPWLQAGLAAAVLGTIGVFAVEVTWVQVPAAVAAVSGVVLTAVGVLGGAGRLGAARDGLAECVVEGRPSTAGVAPTRAASWHMGSSRIASGLGCLYPVNDSSHRAISGLHSCASSTRTSLSRAGVRAWK